MSVMVTYSTSCCNTVMAVAKDSTVGQVMIAEGFGTFFLCYVVLGSSVTFPVDGARSKQNNLSGLA
ncbi:unnamed protein product [Symbiodinium sp. CCMP2456]|nr:unnamed protein product [Symbiodinium sp. CCMP2456]